MNKYGPKAQKVISDVMHDYGKGELKSSSGKKVQDRDQAIAIGISEAQSKGYKVPVNRD